jgi:hypothetical protein
VKKNYLLLGLTIIIITTTLFYLSKNPKVQESITFFPIDPSVTYKTAQTSLTLLGKKTLIWRIDSTLNRSAYLRQDAGFLYSNGRLLDELSGWKQNTKRIEQEKHIVTNRNTLFEAITFHHAELHEKGGRIFSSQAMSSDQLYVINSVSNIQYSFRTPATKEQNLLKQKLDEETERMLQYSWNKGIRHFSIHLGDFQAFPLNLFNNRSKKGLPGFTKEETDRVIGNLWEGLYKNYLLGIKKADGTTISPIGSTIPLILLADNKTHLLVLTETKNGEPILLRQRIEDSD